MKTTSTYSGLLLTYQEKFYYAYDANGYLVTMNSYAFRSGKRELFDSEKFTINGGNTVADTGSGITINTSGGNAIQTGKLHFLLARDAAP